MRWPRTHSGHSWWPLWRCPKCQSDDFTVTRYDDGSAERECHSCKWAQYEGAMGPWLDGRSSTPPPGIAGKLYSLGLDMRKSEDIARLRNLLEAGAPNECN